MNKVVNQINVPKLCRYFNLTINSIKKELCVCVCVLLLQQKASVERESCQRKHTSIQFHRVSDK